MTAPPSAPLESPFTTVMGLGRFGGGLGVTRWLAQCGERVLVTDAADAETLRDALGALEPLVESGQVRVQLGPHRPDDFRSAARVIANPAVPRPWANPFLEHARDAGVPITTEIRLLVERLDRRRVIGVTGSAGKSTTTAMIAHVLRSLGRTVHVGGNLGGSLLGSLDTIGPKDWTVLELSSAQLYWLGADCDPHAAGWSPHVAVLTNIAPNHLDWHGSMEHYESCKRQIFRNQERGEGRVDGRMFDGLRRPIPLPIPGEHNQRNAASAMYAVVQVTGLTPGEIIPHLADFGGLPHRLQVIARHGDQTFVNDSKSTTPEATQLAVASFKRPSRIHLIAGGYDKGADLQPIRDLAPRLGGVYAIGATAEQLAGPGAKVCGDLDTAVAQAISRLQPDGVLLLSPGCASWDQFVHFEARGDHFAALVRDYLATELEV